MEHQSHKDLTHDFGTVWQRLNAAGRQSLKTPDSHDFDAFADTAQKGKFQGEKVIRIKKNNRTFALIYPCCWRHITNHYGTRIGGYSEALDRWVEQAV